MFIQNDGNKLLEGLVNCAVAALLLSGIAMKRTIFAVEDNNDYVVFNLISGNIVSSKSKRVVNYGVY